MEYDQHRHDPRTAAQSLIDWWSLAGVDWAVGEEPRAWGRAAPDGGPAQQPGLESSDGTNVAAGASSPPPRDHPQPAAFHSQPPPAATLEQFLAWLAEDPGQPEASFATQRIMPQVAADADAVLITDMPSAADMTAGRLFSGDEGELARNMLRAVGIDPQNCGMASLLLARPPGGLGDDALWPRAAERMRQLLALAPPRLLLLFGDKTKRALCGATRGDSGGSASRVNLGDGEIRAIPLPAAFIMLQQPERKAAAWKDLRRAVGPR